MSNYIIQDKKSFLNVSDDVIESGISPGTYTVQYNDRSDITSLSKILISTDKLIQITQSKQLEVLTEVNKFFDPKTKAKFDKHGFIYKKAILLHGNPGTGKTCLIAQVIDAFNSHANGIVCYNPSLSGLPKVFGAVPKDFPILVVEEEFDNSVRYMEHHWLSILDGEDQRPNTFFIFTTNYLDKIPARLIRPGRISNLVEIGMPNDEARLAFLKAKLPNKSTIELITLTNATNGLTIDEVKHVILATECLDIPLVNVLKDIKDRPKLQDDDSMDDVDEEEHINSRLKKFLSVMSKD